MKPLWTWQVMWVQDVSAPSPGRWCHWHHTRWLSLAYHYGNVAASTHWS